MNQIVGRPLLEKGWAHKKIHQYREGQEPRLPFRFIRADRYIGPIVKALGHNQIVVIAFDGRTGSKWIPVDLFNRTAEFSTGPFKLAMKTGATILPTFVVRQSDNKHKIIIEGAMDVAVAREEERVETSVRSFAEIFKGYLLKYPCHFAMTLYTIRDEAERGLNRPLFNSEGHVS
jgi:KDO2-lipid IV(A) lauroyltransferase